MFLFGAAKASIHWYQNNAIWRLIGWILSYIVVPLGVGYLGSSMRVSKFENNLKRKDEQVKAVLDAYKELKALESWGCGVPSTTNLQKMEDELPEVDDKLQLNEFYIPNKIYSEIYDIKEEWGRISGEYDKYLKSKKTDGPNYELDTDEKVQELVIRRKNLGDTIKKEFGYTI